MEDENQSVSNLILQVIEEQSNNVVGITSSPSNTLDITIDIKEESKKERALGQMVYVVLEEDGHLSILDGRSDKEGLVFEEQDINRELTEKFKEFKRKRHLDRIRALSYIFQPYWQDGPRGMDAKGKVIYGKNSNDLNDEVTVGKAKQEILSSYLL